MYVMGGGRSFEYLQSEHGLVFWMGGMMEWMAGCCERSRRFAGIGCP